MNNPNLITEEFFIHMNNFRIQMHNFIKVIAKDYDLTGQELIFLLAIAHYKHVTVSKLTNKLNVKQANVSKMVRSLEEKDLIIKQPDPSNLRSFTLSLTPSAVDVAKSIEDAFTKPYIDYDSQIDFDLMRAGMGEMLKLIALFE